MPTNNEMIGPFFYIKKLIAHAISMEKGEKRGNRIDNPYSHERLYDDYFNSGDYINFPRGRVIWDNASNKAIIYIDICVEKTDGAIKQIAEMFDLTDYMIKHDEHYVCPDCMGDIWRDD